MSVRRKKTMKKIFAFAILATLMASSVLGVSPYKNGYDWEKRSHFLPMLCNADINEDGYINGIDFSILSTDWKKKVRQHPEAERSDIDGSGKVGLRDLKLLQRWHGTDISELC